MHLPNYLRPRPVILFSFLLLPVAAFAQVSLAVNATQTVRTVDERVFGLNAVIWDGQTATPQTISLLQAAGVRTIRIPGGSLSDEYHWRTNTNLANTWTWAAGFDRYTTLITSLNAQAFVTVNYGTGTPEEAAAWVAYANASSTLLGTGADVAIGVDAKGYDWKTAGYWSNLRNSTPLATDDGMNFLRVSRAGPIGLKYWEIGNENYGTWETDEQAVKNDPYTYGIRTKQYMAKMKAVDSSIKIGVVAVTGETSNTNNTAHPATNPRTNAVRNGWTPVMLTTLRNSGVTPDYLIYHRYEQAPKHDQPGNPETDAGLLQKAKTWPADAIDLRQQLTDYLGQAGGGVELIVTENNSVYSQPGKQTTSLVNGLYLADSIGNVLQTEINGLVWWDLRNGQDNTNNNDALLYGWRQYGDYGILSTPSSFGSTTAYDPYPTYYVMKLLSKFARGGDIIVQASSNNPLLSIFAAKRMDGSLSLLVINKDRSATQSANIGLTGHNPAATATVYSYGVPQDEAAHTGGGSPDIATTNLVISGSVFASSFGPYSVTVISLNAAPASIAPLITTQPVSQMLLVGAPFNLTVAASGVPAPTYQWQKNGADINGATSNSYSITNVISADSGNYTVTATNVQGAAISNSAVLVVSTVPVVVGQQLSDQTVLVGSPVTFALEVSGNPTPTYQWQKNGVNITGATNAAYMISSAQLSDAGSYTLVASNFAGLLISNAATLTVNAAPVITGQPVVQHYVTAGGVVTFSVSVTGHPAPTYQWKKNGVNIGGATESSYTIGNAQTGSAGSYTVVATNSQGTVTSSAGTLTVVSAPVHPVARDFNSDGKADILWRNVVSGDVAMWFMNGTSFQFGEVVTNVDLVWELAGTGDFNGDGQTDILWRNTISGDVALWVMNGTTFQQGYVFDSVPLVWQIMGTGDFNGDGKPDIVWRNMYDGSVALWVMNGTTFQQGYIFDKVDLVWELTGTGDFNGDAKTDLLWRNTYDGSLALWVMNGTSFQQGFIFDKVNLVWELAATGDFNGDGKTDILWRNTYNGDVALWVMNGTSFQQGFIFNTISLAWKMVK